MGLRIIINADDLGISESVNQAIFSCLERKVISSATLLANGPAIKSATCEAKHFPDGTFGAHLNATQFAPLTTNPGLRPLLRDDGQFAGDIHQIRLGNDILAALQEEWIAQIKRLQDLGVSVSHIDSHNHVHTMPAMFFVLKAVQKYFRIRRVRSTRNLYPRDVRVGNVLLAKKWLWAQALRNWYGTRTTRWSMPFIDFHARRREFAGRSTTVELVTHPGNANRTEETKLLDTNWRRELGSRVEIIRFSNL